MADKLKTLMGVVPRRYQVSFTGIPSSTLSIPIGMLSGAGLAPAAGTWLEVVSVAGAGRLRGAILSTAAPPGTGYKMQIRVTVDGVAHIGEVILGATNTAYVLLPEMFIGSSLCLLPEVPFSTSLKIEVLRQHTSVPAMTLNYFYQLEAA